MWQSNPQLNCCCASILLFDLCRLKDFLHEKCIQLAVTCGAWMRGKVDNEGQVCQIMKMSALLESLDSLSSKLIDSSLLKRWQRFLS